MICTLTARRLKPGAYETFRAAWNPAQALDDALGPWTHIYHCRDVADPDVVISFGLFEGTLEELRQAQAKLGRQSQVDRIGPHVQQVLLDGSYEIVEELTPEDAINVLMRARSWSRNSPVTCLRLQLAATGSSDPANRPP